MCIALLFLARSGESGQSDRIISFPLAAVSSCCVVFLFFFFSSSFLSKWPQSERARPPAMAGVPSQASQTRNQYDAAGRRPSTGEKKKKKFQRAGK